MSKEFKSAVWLCFLGIATRLLPHEPNMTAITATTIFAGWVFRDKIYALLIPVCALLLSDVVIGFHSGMYAVYGSIFMIWLLARQEISMVLLAPLASVLFFVVTNLACFWSGMYGPGLEGLTATFTMALPFFKWTVLGDLGYLLVLMLVYSKVTTQPKLRYSAI